MLTDNGWKTDNRGYHSISSPGAKMWKIAVRVGIEDNSKIIFLIF